MSPSLERPQPPYLQIADHFRSKITEGELGEGDRLPTVADIADTWKVSPGTAHRAIRTLRGEKLVTTNQQGTKVLGGRAAASPSERVRRHDSSSHEQVTVTEAGVVTARAYVGDLLGLNADAGNLRVIRREAITYRDDTPVCLSVSWLPVQFLEDAPELTGISPIPSLLKLISQKAGRTANHGRDWFTARGADEREARALNVEVGAPIVAATSVWSDQEGVIEYREFVAPENHVTTHEYDLNLD